MPEDVSPNHPVKPQEAREQASEYMGFMASKSYDIGNGEKWELPNPAFMDPDMKGRYLEHLRFMSEDLDTYNRTDPVTKETAKVQHYPLRYRKKLVVEEELLCVALMGEDGDYEKYLKTAVSAPGKVLKGDVPDIYAKFIAADGRPGQLNMEWQVMQRQLQERLQRDPKSS